ncbi:hypothetical protein [Nocardia nova]|uniref:hypothetical protein n=1 Tax=Nocardia nova TaxID=37330 RepID=UPI0009DFD9A1|nr:hypothetical protein [Nocardia nova]
MIAGDICFDRLRASRPLRASYRRAFGLSSGQKLLVISSTWGPNSLLATAPDFPLRLAEILPSDEFRIVVAPHPNIAAEHSGWQFREYSSAAVRAGVHLPRDEDAWRAALVAADLTIGDGGSVPFYSTALGHPLLLATAPHHTVAPDSPVAQLLRHAPELDRTGDLEAQVRQALSDHDPNRFAAITAATTSVPDTSAEILRATMYRAMELPEPPGPALISALPLPPAPLPGPTSHLVVAQSVSDRVVNVTRYPAERLHGRHDGVRGAHLAVGVDDPLRRWLELADVLIGVPGSDTSAWIEDSLSQLPGCAVAGAPSATGNWLIGDRSRRLLVRGHPQACRLFVSVVCRTTVVGGSDWNSLAGNWIIECGGSRRQVVAEVTGIDYED